METELDLKKLEKQSFTSYFQDGLWDIVIGMMLLATAVSTILSDVGTSDPLRIAIYMPIMLSGSVIIGLGKRYITIPRLGLVKFSRQRMNKLMKLNAGIVAAVLISALLVGVIPLGPGWLGEYGGDLVFSILVLVAFSMIAYFFDFRRMYLYAVLFALLFFSVVALDDGSTVLRGIPALVAALAILGFGSKLLLGFVQDFPLTGEEAADGL